MTKKATAVSAINPVSAMHAISTVTRPRRSLLVDAAVAACILASRVAAADQSTEAGAAGSTELSEITVTAQRRTENLQDVPITIQALTSETLTQLNVTTFDDIVKYTPNVTTASWGPGQDLIFMRGLSSGALGTQVVGSILRPAGFCGAIGFKPSVGAINRGGSMDLLLGRGGLAVGDVLADRPAEQPRILQHHTDRAAQCVP